MTQIAGPVAAPAQPTPFNPPAGVHRSIGAVCALIPPLWDLENYVAVNPFLGFSGQPLPAAARAVRDGLDGQVLPDVAFYRRRWAAGAFSAADVRGAAARAGADPEALLAVLDGAAPAPLRRAAPVLSFAERLDRRDGTEWQSVAVRHITRWCGAAIPQGAARWSQTAARGQLFASWREHALADRTLSFAGLRGWQGFVAQLPADPYAAAASALEILAVPAAQHEAYLYRLVAGVYGWASYLRRQTWQGPATETGALGELLAVLVCVDAAVARLAPRQDREPLPASAPELVEDERTLAVLQAALEDGYVRTLHASLRPAPEPAPIRPAVQAVFCIDVRSEPLRRHFEAQSDRIETRGFAGFFGVSLAWDLDGAPSARCPVLLQPGVTIRAAASMPPAAGAALVKELAVAPVAAFSFVELAGVAYAAGLVRDTLAAKQAPPLTDSVAPFSLTPDGRGGGLVEQAAVDLAAGILTNLGLRTVFARLILLCGHGGQSANNPHAAGLDCGACGGHSGAINARVAAALLNEPGVRSGLADRGWRIPLDTVFLAGHHDTTLDEVTLLDPVPPSHEAERAQLAGWLDVAGAAVRAERAPSLALAPRPAGLLERLIGRRARDWSEVRPEWALARNAAFIVARRERTRGVDLGGRTFLHEYDHTTDPDDAILTLILTAPMVVASWINLQYMASTVDNALFGCGTKTLHNRIGSLGVVLGNGGDLRTGLAAQSVERASGEWYHEPLRLQVVVEAPPEKIAAVLAQQPGVRDLVENGWVRLFQLDSDGAGLRRWEAGAWV